MSRLMNVAIPSSLRCGREVERHQTLDDLVDHLVERPHRDVAGDRRHLDRDVVHVGAADQLVDALEPAQRLILAEHGLAEQVEVELRAALADRGDRRAELVGARVDDEVTDHLAQHPPCDRHDRRRQHGGDGAARPCTAARRYQGRKSGHERGDTTQIGCRSRQALGTHHAVDEADRERKSVGVFQHAGESLGGGVHVDLGALGDPPLRQHTARGEVGPRSPGCREVGVPLIRVGHHGTQPKACASEPGVWGAMSPESRRVSRRGRHCTAICAATGALGVARRLPGETPRRGTRMSRRADGATAARQTRSVRSRRVSGASSTIAGSSWVDGRSRCRLPAGG